MIQRAGEGIGLPAVRLVAFWTADRRYLVGIGNSETVSIDAAAYRTEFGIDYLGTYRTNRC